MMKGHRALLGTLGVLALALAPACSRREAQEAKEESKETASKIGEESKETADKVGEKSKEVGGKVAEEAKEAGQKIKEGAKEVASEIDAKKQTMDVKTALMADKSIDASHIDVDTDADTKTVTLKGTVPSSAQKSAAEKVARDKAEGYKIHNRLTIARK